MKLRKNRFIIFAASALLLAPAAFAADSDGTWITAGNGSWAIDTNWDGGPPGVIADGAGFTAYFDAVDITATTTVTLDAARTIGNLTFGDLTGTSGWVLATGTAGPLTLAGTTPTITTNTSTTISAAIVGASGFTKSGTNTLTLTGGLSNTLGGSINVNEGTLIILDGLSHKNMSGTITVASGAILYYGQNFNSNNLTNALTLSGSGSGSYGALNVAYNGNASGAITLADNTTISHDWNNGTVSGSITGTDLNLELKTTQKGQGSLTISGPISLGTGAITVKSATDGISTSAVNLSNSNSYSGGTLISTGTLGFGNAGALGSGAVTFSDGTALRATASVNLPNELQIGDLITGKLDTSSGSINATLSGPITGLGNLTKIGAGTITLAGGDGNTLAGAINVNLGRLNIAQSGGNSSLKNMPQAITVASGGTLGYDQGFSGNNLTNNITLSGPGANSNGALILDGNAIASGTITLAANATISHSWNNATVSGSIAGTDLNLELKTLQSGQNGLVVSGPITLGTGGITVTGAANGGGYSVMLSGDNTYSGGTTVAAGTLVVNNTTGSGTGSGAVTVISGAKIGGSGTIGGTLNVPSGAILSPGAAIGSTPFANNVGTLAVGNNTMIDGTYSCEIDDTSMDLIAVTGDLDVTDGTLTVVQGTTGANQSSYIIATYTGTLAGTLTLSAPVSGYTLVHDTTNKQIRLDASVGSDYASWASSQTPPVTGGENGDDDNDGVKNLVEYALTNGGERGVLSGNTITFTKRGAPYGGDLTYIIETSETLAGSWTPAVTHSPAQLGSPISYDLAPVPGTPKKFARLKVVKAP